MKKFKFILLVTLATIPLLQSCNDSEGDYPAWRSFVTVNIPSEVTGSEYYFTLDNDKTLYPSDKTRFAYNTSDDKKESKDGRRALIFFNKLNQPKEGYDYNIAIYNVQDILSKQVDTATDDADAKTQFGNDRITIEGAQLSSKWLDIYYRVIVTGEANEKHRISLVNNAAAVAPAEMPADYTYLEFRHKIENGNGLGGSYAESYVAYQLGDLHPEKTGKKGLFIGVIGPDGTKTSYEQVDYTEEQQ